MSDAWLKHEMRVLVFVHGAFETLVKAGLVQGKPVITPKGIAIYDQLRASGFRPTLKEVATTIRKFGMAEDKSETDGLARLILDGSD